MYLKFSTGKYCSIAGKRGHWPASEDISLPLLPYLYLTIVYSAFVRCVLCLYVFSILLLYTYRPSYMGFIT